MLTLQKDKTSTEIVELHKRSTRSKKPHGVVYYSHNTKASGNVAPAAGVLELHKTSLKKIWKLSNADFNRICVMIDTNAEPDSGEPLRSEYWELHKVYERALRTEMYLGDQDELYFEHHVLHTPMWRFGWHINTVTNQTLVDSYALFGRLREMGIRAHSWV